ncbi:MAG: hypothetical protein PHS60_15965, partial [Zavarzinia sp.]|nr:hypothetical protein [Zavarzinia sp.]
MSRAPRTTYADQARAAWGAPPAWISTLAETVDRDGVKMAAEAIGYSATTAYEVIRGQYKGRLDAVEQAVRAALMRDHVTCPVLGEITGAACLQAQSRKVRP